MGGRKARGAEPDLLVQSSPGIRFLPDGLTTSAGRDRCRVSCMGTTRTESWSVRCEAAEKGFFNLPTHGFKMRASTENQAFRNRFTECLRGRLETWGQVFTGFRIPKAK